MNINKINILILNWNSSLDIVKSLKGILDSSYTNYRIILIDNSSLSNDKKNIINIYNSYKEKLEIHLLLNDENYGYAGGNNRGYEYLKEKKINGNILILNPDVVIMNNTIDEMNNCLIGDVGAVMTRTMNTGNTIIYDCIKLNGFKQKWLTTDKNIIETDYVAGSCMLLKREIIDKISLFDEDFFMYWEEVDLSLRIKELGYKLVSTTMASIIREENSKDRSINAVYYSTRNSFILFKKYKVFKLFDLVVFILYSFLYSLKKSILLKRLDFIKKYLQGLISGFKIIFN